MKYVRMKLYAGLVLMCVAMNLQAADEMKPGLMAEYFEFDTGVADFPKVPAAKLPSIRRVDRNIMVEDCQENFNNTNLNRNFYVKWTGSIKIDKAGKYKFLLESDDGSRMFVDGKQIINNSGTHPMEKKDGSLNLAPGLHDVKIEYFQGDGGMGCKLTWVQPGKGEEPVAEGNLVHKADSE